MPAKKKMTKLEGSEIFYGTKTILFSVVRSERKTLEIAVLPSGNVQVTAPLNSPLELIEDKVRKRAPWITQQKFWFDQFLPHIPIRQYLGGESHPYLGRHFRLKISEANAAGVRLAGGFFWIDCGGKPDPHKVKALLNQWYREKAKPLFLQILAERLKKMKIEKAPQLQIRAMRTRWGSLSKGGILTLNIRLVGAPRECIEYVVTHELCHLNHHNHSPAFYKQLEAFLPDWERRKLKLEHTVGL